MKWFVGFFILQSVTLITVALLGSFVVNGLNRIEGMLETIADLIAYDYDEAAAHEADHDFKAAKERE